MNLTNLIRLINKYRNLKTEEASLNVLAPTTEDETTTQSWEITSLNITWLALKVLY